jgi:lipoprotein NlpI
VAAPCLDFLAEGEKQLSLNNPAKALTYLEAALAQAVPDERLLLNLGLAYQRTGKPLDAQKAFRQGADLQGPARKTFLLNLGVSAYSTKDWSAAEAADTEALTLDPTFAEALLNRANARLNAQSWAGAAEDYRGYQAAAPANPQKQKIDQLLALLDQAAGEAEASRLAEETRKKKADEEAAAALAATEAERQKAEAAALAQKQADDAAAAAEKQKQDEILARIRESLAAASDDSKALSTGQSGVKADTGDFSLDP